jgi:hypothetical protein
MLPPRSFFLSTISLKKKGGGKILLPRKRKSSKSDAKPAIRKKVSAQLPVFSGEARVMKSEGLSSDGQALHLMMVESIRHGVRPSSRA